MNELVYYNQVAQSLSLAVYHASVNLQNVHGLLRMTIESGMWRKRLETITGSVVEFESFEEFVQTKPPQGLGTDIQTLRLLCCSNNELLQLIDTASSTSPTPPIESTTEKAIRQVKRFSRQWTIDRLIETKQTDLLRDLLAGKVTPFAIQVKMGWRKKAKR